MYINRHGRDSEMCRTSGINALMTLLALTAKSLNILMQFKPNKELCYRRRTARRPMSVEISSTAAQLYEHVVQ